MVISSDLPNRPAELEKRRRKLKRSSKTCLKDGTPFEYYKPGCHVYDDEDASFFDDTPVDNRFIFQKKFYEADVGLFPYAFEEAELSKAAAKADKAQARAASKDKKDVFAGRGSSLSSLFDIVEEGASSSQAEAHFGEAKYFK